MSIVSKYLMNNFGIPAKHYGLHTRTAFQFYYLIHIEGGAI